MVLTVDCNTINFSGMAMECRESDCSHEQIFRKVAAFWKFNQLKMKANKTFLPIKTFFLRCLGKNVDVPAPYF